MKRALLFALALLACDQPVRRVVGPDGVAWLAAECRKARDCMLAAETECEGHGGYYLAPSMPQTPHDLFFQCKDKRGAWEK